MPFKKKTINGKTVRHYYSADTRIVSDHSVWLEHPDWPSYRFSPEGGCLRIIGGEPKIKPPPVKKSGYIQYALTESGKTSHISAHRLVARIFCPGYALGLQVNHKNGIKTDNRADNLEWVTASENKVHALRVLGRNPARGSRVGGAKLKEHDVVQIKKMIRAGSLFHREIAAQFCVGRECISMIARGRIWKHIQ